VRVLLVEDDVPMAAALRRALNASGIVADVATSGGTRCGWCAGPAACSSDREELVRYDG
jgi:DNA-binding response OmpR family regulator